MKQTKKLAGRLAAKLLNRSFVAAAVHDHADLSAFGEKPSLRIILGLLAIGLSYLIGWPAIAGLGIVAIKLHQPWIAVIGGPMTYGLSHLVFLLGMYLSGAVYSLIFLRWLTRIVMERLLPWAGR